MASYNNFGEFVQCWRNSFSIESLFLARIITNLIETRDLSMVLNLFVSLVLNLSIVVACTVYQYGPRRKAKDKKKQQKKRTE